jgi:hypothetical protein
MMGSSPKVPDTPPPPNSPIAANYANNTGAGTSWIKNASGGFAGTLLTGNSSGASTTGSTNTAKNTMTGQ